MEQGRTTSHAIFVASSYFSQHQHSPTKDTRPRSFQHLLHYVNLVRSRSSRGTMQTDYGCFYDHSSRTRTHTKLIIQLPVNNPGEFLTKRRSLGVKIWSIYWDSLRKGRHGDTKSLHPSIYHYVIPNLYK